MNTATSEKEKSLYINNQSLNEYLYSVCPCLLEIDKDQFYKTLHDETNQNLINEFRTNSFNKCLIISSFSDNQNKRLKIFLDVNSECINSNTIAFVKRSRFRNDSQISEKQLPYSSQLQIINLSYLSNDSSSYELTQNYIQHCFLPLFNKIKSSEAGLRSFTTENDKQMYQTLIKELNSISTTLNYCIQKFEVPEIILDFHPEIKERVASAQKIGKIVQVDDFKTLIEDSEFINQLALGVQKWIKDIETLFKVNYDVEIGTFLQEINFWVSLERSANLIEHQLKFPEIKATLDILKLKKKFHITTSFESDLKVAQLSRNCNKIKTFLINIPINDLISAISLEEIEKSLQKIFSALSNAQSIEGYDTVRCYKLIKVLTRDMKNVLLKLLSNMDINLLSCNFEELKSIYEHSLMIFIKFNEEFNKFKNSLKGSSNENKFPILNFDHDGLRIKIESIYKLRKEHKIIEETVKEIFTSKEFKDTESLTLGNKDLEEAYSFFTSLDSFDLTVNGDLKWMKAKDNYKFKLKRLEKQIVTLLREKIKLLHNSTDMIKIFKKIRSLNFRPRIDKAVKEYQQEIIKNIEEELHNLNKKSLKSYSSSENNKLCVIRNIVPTAGTIIWIKQIERKVTGYYHITEMILDKDWTQKKEGKLIHDIGERILNRLSIEKTFKSFVSEIEKVSEITFDSKIFTVKLKKRTDKLELLVNIDQRIIIFSKEVKSYTWIGDELNVKVDYLARKVNEILPQVLRLQESLKIFDNVMSKIDDEIACLLIEKVREIYEIINQGSHLTWTYAKALVSYVNILVDKLLNFDIIVNDLWECMSKINTNLNGILSCKIEYQVLEEKIQNIQSIVHEVCSMKLSNTQKWIEKIDERIEANLAIRLTDLIKIWIVKFEKFNKDNPSDYSIDFQPTVHEIRLQEQVLFIEPPLQQSRYYWTHEFNKLIGKICNLNRIELTNLEVINLHNGRAGRNKNYSNLYNRVFKDSIFLAYRTIEKFLSSAEKYAKSWLNYQSLWDINIKSVTQRLGDNIESWQDFLYDIKSSRMIFDNTEVEKQFGPIIINYSIVQTKITNKYDLLQKEILGIFGATFNENMREFMNNTITNRKKLEKINFNNQSVSDLAASLKDIEDIKAKSSDWDKELEKYKSVQKVLDRQKFHPSADWLYLEQVEGEYSTFKQIKDRRVEQLERDHLKIIDRVINEEVLEKRNLELLQEAWKVQIENQEDIDPTIYLKSIKNLTSKLDEIKDSYSNISQAQVLLNLEPCNMKLVSLMEEDIKSSIEFWDEINKIWITVNSLNDTYIAVLQPMKLEQLIKTVDQMIDELPSKLKITFSSNSIKQKFDKIIKKILITKELKSDALKASHWKQILDKLQIKLNFNEVLVKTLWETDLLKVENEIKEILNIAKGEQVLDDILKSIRNYWSNFELELAIFQQKYRIIRGWDDLFAKIEEDLANLSSMKLSPYYKNFEENVGLWEKKLSKAFMIFEVWRDVQKRWLYLEGIFNGVGDIKEQLPEEYSNFNAVNNEFLKLMRVSFSPRALLLEVIGTSGLQKTLERLDSLLGKIQKALGNYLEIQRSKFSRFYFIGDEDLLEMLGHSKDVIYIQKHLSKMFAGINSLKIDDNQISIFGMASKDEEYVEFFSKIFLLQNPKIDVLLSQVENQMNISLAKSLENSIKAFSSIQESKSDPRNIHDKILAAIESFAVQVVILCIQVIWTQKVEFAIERKSLKSVIEYVLGFLAALAEKVSSELEKSVRHKFEQLITELVHQRDNTRTLLTDNPLSTDDFNWQYQMRFKWVASEKDPLKNLIISMSISSFYFGFEYLGINDRLVQTPLTDRCFLTLAQALHLKMGGSPFGPAGTGKTETVKALGAQLGRFVLVFNCDETFDFHAIGRIFVGLCQVGAWGCFDEFNRLEERMLSAVSQQILAIQTGVREHAKSIDLLGKDVRVNANMGIFVTMNPGYAGRSNLPENLKQLFRQVAMVKPDRELIAQVMLFSQGYSGAEIFAGKIVTLFELCNDQLSKQPHYDFGLRALKSVLVAAGNLKRKAMSPSDLVSKNNIEFEQNILIRSILDTIVPKLLAEDITLLNSLIQGVFPGANLNLLKEDSILEKIKEICLQKNYLSDSNFVEKILQLNQIQQLSHGIMLVGPTGSGKSSVWRTLFEALNETENSKGEFFIIDPKAISKEDLFGKLDSATLEWTDGIFTYVLRKYIEKSLENPSRRSWIVFDGDVDPEWAENLNSVLDDNKLLTLPNGERLSIPANVRILFEVESLKYATLATVSRCGMIWFSRDVVTIEMLIHHNLSNLRKKNPGIEVIDRLRPDEKESKNINEIQLRETLVDSLGYMFEGEDCLIHNALKISREFKHVMEYTGIRVINSAFSLISAAIDNVIDHNKKNHTTKTQDYIIFARKQALLSIIWSLGGSLSLHQRVQFCSNLSSYIKDIELPPLDKDLSLLDYKIEVSDPSWQLWKHCVKNIEIDSQKVLDADCIIPTIDTLRHQDIIFSLLQEHKPLLLCGPPGSGKTMTLLSTLKSLPDFEVVFINFSSTTSPALLLKTFEQYCEYHKTPHGTIMRPKIQNKWLVLFCDEINLPDIDKFGTQKVITFLRQITEQKGFWRNSDKQWISIERIQFVGACNPPTDVGRQVLSNRFLRHISLIFIDFPGEESLKQIYGTFNRAILKRATYLSSYSASLTSAMVEFYSRCQLRFTSDMQAHYIYSPRELTRWKYAINEGIPGIENLEDIVRLWAHEALRLFQDRLVATEEREWCENLVDEIALKYFPNINRAALERPILFSSYNNPYYRSTNFSVLKSFIEDKLKKFNEANPDTKLVVFDALINHMLRIDRVLKQPLGHSLLVGASGVGKTTIARFVAWLNELSIFQLKVGRDYSLADFDNDLRDIMIRSGCKNEKICFIIDESNIVSVAFLEKMNALLASGEVPGLFEGDSYTTLLSQCKESIISKTSIESEEQIYKLFVRNVQKNLHVIFTMNPSNPDFSNKTSSSPALFNRCVVNWFGDWPDEALLQVSSELIQSIKKSKNSDSDSQGDELVKQISKIIVHIYKMIVGINDEMASNSMNFNYITVRDFLDFIKQFTKIFNVKQAQLIEQHTHLRNGLIKLEETEIKVQEMQANLDKYKIDLIEKEKVANEKLNLILEQQRDAEEKREISSKIAAELKSRQDIIDEKQAKNTQILEKGKEILEKAQSKVESIQNQDIDLIKNLSAPAKYIKLSITAVVCMLRKDATPIEWSEVRAELSKTTFRSSIIHLDKNQVSYKLIRGLQQNFLNNPDWNIDLIRKAYEPAGKFAEWLVSIVEFVEALNTLNKSIKEVKELEVESLVLGEKYHIENKIVEELQSNINQFKADYAVLIAEIQMLMNEIKTVSEKVDRSKKIIIGLQSERDRWGYTSQNFEKQLDNLLGDSLISGAYLAYIGFFDFYYRKALLKEWKEYIKKEGVNLTDDLSLSNFLSTPSDRLKWQECKLPKDDLCLGNAIILKNFNRYPLMIDPAGQALEYILNLYKERKMIKTTLNSESFMKDLENCIRFGIPILIQDLEKVDQVINTVLNREIYEQGGRQLIRVGDKEITYNDQFTLFMITRDSNARFPPDLCSRVTFVNFTVTQSSLQDQCLNLFLNHERPDIDRKRTDLLKLQGEYVAQLRELEDALLNALSNSEGSILDKIEVIETLENLKAESAKITEKMVDSDKDLTEIESVINQYEKVSEASSKIYFCLEALAQIHHMYQFSLTSYMSNINTILSSEELTGITETSYQERLDYIYDNLFTLVYRRTSTSLLHQDKLTFALRLVQIKIDDLPTSSDLFKLLFKIPTVLESQISSTLLNGSLSSTQVKLLDDISTHKKFKNLVPHMEKYPKLWLKILTPTRDPEDFIPSDWQEIATFSKDNSYAESIANLILIKILRPEKFIASCTKLISTVLFDSPLENIIDLESIVSFESSAKIPIIICSAAGQDSSHKIEILSKKMKRNLSSIAIGSAEGYIQAGKDINAALKDGGWILLKNVHLAPNWLSEIEKKLNQSQAHVDFRMFMTMEFNDKVPKTLIKQSIKIIQEAPEGVKSFLKRVDTLTSRYNDDKSITKDTLQILKKINFMLAWLHAIIIERLRFAPIGWSKSYEFNEADLRCAVLLINEIITRHCKDSTKEDIQIEGIKRTLIQNIYGGKIDNEFDQNILASIVEKLFKSSLLNNDRHFKFNNDQTLELPRSYEKDELVEWIDGLSEDLINQISGLPPNIEDYSKEKLANSTLDNLRLLQDNIEKKLLIKGSEDKKIPTKNITRNVEPQITKYLDLINEEIMLPANQISPLDPIGRFIQREILKTNELIHVIRSDLIYAKSFFDGKIKTSLQLRNLIKDVSDEVTPSNWKRILLNNLTLSDWIMNFKKRIINITSLKEKINFNSEKIWIGGFFNPEAFITTTRQYVSQINKWSLEDIEMNLSVYSGEKLENSSFLITGLTLSGASWNEKLNSLDISNSLYNHLPTMKLIWKQRTKLLKGSEKNDDLIIPIYHTKSRKNLVATVKMKIGKDKIADFYPKGVCLILCDY